MLSGSLDRSPRLSNTVVILPCSKKFPLLQLYICKLGCSCVAPRMAAPLGLCSLRSSASRLVRSFLATCGRWLRLFALVGLAPPGTPSRVGVSGLWCGCARPLFVSVLGMRRAPRVYAYLSLFLLLAALVAVTIIVYNNKCLTMINFVTICHCCMLFRPFFVLGSFTICYYICIGNIATQL